MPVSERSVPRRRNAAPADRFGCATPRIFTPPLRRLEPRSAATEKRTLGYYVIDFAGAVLKIELMPWQRFAFVHGLELLPDGTFRFRTVLLLVARQNGKSLLGEVLALYFLFCLSVALVIGTAQSLDLAEEVWQAAVNLAEDAPELAPLIERVVRGNGKKSLELVSGDRYKVQAANRRGGRGHSGDLVLMDELREHQTWDAWAAITKTTLARVFAQVWAFSNAGDALSVVLRHLRKMAHAVLGDPDGICKDDAPGSLPDEVELSEESALCLMEWSARPNCDLDDRAGWAQANPALGHTITERALAAARGTDPEWVFRTEVLCQWNSGSVEGPFPAGAWETCLDGLSSIRDAGEVAVGVDVSADRSFTSVVLCAMNAAGVPHVELTVSRAGSEWLLAWLVERQKTGRLTAVAMQGKGAPVSPLAADLEAAGLPVIRWEGPALAAGTGKFYDAVCRAQLRHGAQPLLDVAAATATTKPLGDSWVWNRRQSATDIAPLVAATAAFWALTCQPVKRVSVYEDNAELIIA